MNNFKMKLQNIYKKIKIFAGKTKLKIKQSKSKNVISALLIFTVVGVWISSGVLFPSDEFEVKVVRKLEVQIKTRDIKAETYYPKLSVPGRIMSEQSVLIKSQVGGTVEKIFVKSGAYVKKGQFILRIKGSNAQAVLRQAKASYKAARIKYKANKQLLKQKLLSYAGFEIAKADFETAKANLDSAKNQFEKYNIKAPFSGRVGVIRIIQDQNINAGADVVDLENNSTYKFNAYVSSKQIKNIKAEQKFIGKTSNGKDFSGKLTAVSATPEKKTRTYKIEGAIQGGQYSSGESATISLFLAKRQAHRIDSGLSRVNAEGDLGVKVVVDGIVEFKAIKIVNENIYNLWVTGLDENTTIIVEGAGFAEIGKPIN